MSDSARRRSRRSERRHKKNRLGKSSTLPLLYRWITEKWKALHLGGQTAGPQAPILYCAKKRGAFAGRGVEAMCVRGTVCSFFAERAHGVNAGGAAGGDQAGGE